MKNLQVILLLMVLLILNGCESQSQQKNTESTSNKVYTSYINQNRSTPETIVNKPSVSKNAERKPSGKSDEMKIEVGDFVLFGKYFGDPILWKCVKKEGSSPMLVSECILCLKAFDAAESGTGGSGNDDVQKYGSNKWYNSNIREWLNAVGEVKYTTQAPAEGAVSPNAYADEPGFFSNFSLQERDLLKSVDHDGVPDKVYLLSNDELVLLGSEITKEPTIKAIQNSSYKDLGFTVGVGYWTRTPTDLYPSSVHCVSSSGFITASAANGGTVGILPVINLKSDIFASGKGTKTDPYK